MLFSLLVVLVVAAIVFFLVLRNSSEISIAENGIGSLFSRIQSVFTGAANSVREFTQRWRDFDKLQDEYDALAIENQQLSLQLDSAQEAVRSCRPPWTPGAATRPWTRSSPGSSPGSPASGLRPSPSTAARTTA